RFLKELSVNRRLESCMNKPNIFALTALREAMTKSALVSVLLALGACATLPETGARQATVNPPASAAPAPAVIGDNSAEAAAAAAAAERAEAIADINRDGRVIQLGRFVEEAPAVPQLPNDVVELNYEQEDLRTVIEQLGGVL